MDDIGALYHFKVLKKQTKKRNKKRDKNLREIDSLYDDFPYYIYLSPKQLKEVDPEVKLFFNKDALKKKPNAIINIDEKKIALIEKAKKKEKGVRISMPRKNI